MSDLLILPCHIGGFRTLKDGSVKLEIETWELKPSDFAIMGELMNRSGFMAFQETEFSPEFTLDIPDLKPEFKSDKSVSQRLRNVLYVYWQQLGETEDFDTFYRRKMEGLIETIKGRME